MKYCPLCRSTYTDKSLLFCLQDGKELTDYKNKTSQMETAIISDAKYSSDQPTVEYSPDEPIIKEDQSNSKDENDSFNTHQLHKEDQNLLNQQDITSKIFSYSIILIIGGILGVAGYYFLTPKPADVVSPPITQTPIENIEYKSFEDLRRTADENPQKYLFMTMEKADSAEEYYLLGRSYLLAGRYQDAKQSFTEAKNRLATADKVNSKILATDIAMGLAIVDSSTAIKVLEKELPANPAK